MEYEWIKYVAKFSDDCLTLIFFDDFNKKIEPNSLPENITTLTFGHNFNQKIEPYTLPKNLSNLTFGESFNQKIDLEILPYNLKYINFNWTYFKINKFISYYFDMVNNIPKYYDVKLFLKHNIFDIDGPIWPIHVCYYKEKEWSSEIYDVIDKYVDPFYGNITVLINKETYEPYSLSKSALK